MKMTNLIISVSDVIGLPSGKDHPEDYTDFRISKNVIDAIMDYKPAKVSLVDSREELHKWGTEDDMVIRDKSIGFFLFEVLCTAVSPFIGKTLDDAVEQAVYRNEEGWTNLFVGMHDIAKNKGGIYISTNDFANGRFTSIKDYQG